MAAPAGAIATTSAVAPEAGSAGRQPALAASAAEPLFDLSPLGVSDAATTCEILQLFAQACDEDLAALHQAVGARQAELACHWAHRMLGASRMIGAPAVQRLCLRLQESSHAQDWGDVRAALQELELAHRQLRRAMLGS